jgi:hypothetical protein
MKFSSTILLVASLGGVSSLSATTLLHYRVNSTDAGTVAGGTVPGVDGSADGTVAFGAVGLSDNVPSLLPTGGGDRSLVFDGASGINLPGSQQLLNSTLESEGGFTMETWFSYAGGGNINSIIDYAGTEKLVREAAGTGAAYRNNSAPPLYGLGDTTGDEWHYVAIVFQPTSTVDGAGGITGDFTFYFDSTTPIGTETGVTISNFGDSLNRTIGVGTHPVGFGGDFFNGLIYEPRVSTGALDASELLIASVIPEPGTTSLVLCGFVFGLARRRR